LILIALQVPAPADADTAAAEPVNCYVVFGEICFPSSDITSQSITYPVDFAVDEINLEGGAHIAIYEGIGLGEQDDVTALAKSRQVRGQSGNWPIAASVTYGRQPIRSEFPL
jgi:hypothetical protein